ncbi:MAG: hypothetical protein ACOWW1_06330 [archaeon]
MNQKLLCWLKQNQGIDLDSPRKEAFGGNPQGFIIRHIDNEKNCVRISFSQKRTLAFPLYFWMFERVLNYLSKNPMTTFPIGARLKPPYPKESIEGEIWKNPKPYSSEYKSAPHILDILTLAGFTNFAYTQSRETNRKVQGAEFSTSEHYQPKPTISTSSDTITKESFIEEHREKIKKWIFKHKDEIINDRLNYRWKNHTRKQCEKSRNDINKAIIQSRIRNHNALDLKTLDKIIKWGFGRKYPTTGRENAEEVTRKAFNCLDNDDIKKATITLLEVTGLGISRVTKIIGLSDQENLCIYDSRVGYALRDLTVNGKRLHLIPPAMTKRERGKLCDRINDKERWAIEYERVLWTIEQIKDYMNELGCTYRQADVEMALFMMGK